MPEAVQILRVALPVPLHRCFDYHAPAATDAQPGARVRVPFGRRRLIGMVVDLPADSDIPASGLKPVEDILDQQPVVSPDWLAFCQWVADYYHYPLGETIATALPAALRKGRPATYQPLRGWAITEQGRDALDQDKRLARAVRQRRVLEVLAAQDGVIPESHLKKSARASAQILRTLSDKRWIRATTIDKPQSQPIEAGPALSPAQQAAVEAVLAHRGEFHPCLLEGVTGSGKTEVYVALARAEAEADRQTLMLVPEIGLTPALIARFSERLGTEPAVLHSALNETERLLAWQRAARGDAAVVIGTRSAVFTPLARPGAIIVDEEHDSSFKQQDGLRYSARDVAVRRAQMQAIPILLGSATPSMESLHNVQTGRYQLTELPTRAGGARPPQIEVIDLRRQPMMEGLSDSLLRHMDRHLAEAGQIMLFLNRRGYAPSLICHGCGWVADCRRCDVRYTYHHAISRLRCHHCGGERPLPAACPECASTEFQAVGHGTERIEYFLHERYPDVGMVRIDRDTTRRKNALTDLLEEVSSQRAQILIGTQMLAKGHDFPELSMVGVLNTDGGLFGVDFRGPERMAQLITQVAGRAGRGARPGEVFIQTHHPDHPLLMGLLRDGYNAFARQALAEREAAGYPPYGYLCLLRAEATQNQAPLQFLQDAAGLARRRAGQDIEVWEAVPAPMERRAGRYRAQLLIQARKRPALHQLLERLIPAVQELPQARKVRWSVDVDPLDML